MPYTVAHRNQPGKARMRQVAFDLAQPVHARQADAGLRQRRVQRPQPVTQQGQVRGVIRKSGRLMR